MFSQDKDGCFVPWQSARRKMNNKHRSRGEQSVPPRDSGWVRSLDLQYSVPFAVADGQDSSGANPLLSVLGLSPGHLLPRTVLNTTAPEVVFTLRHAGTLHVNPKSEIRNREGVLCAF
jgi:hypothetical protein